MPKRQRLSRVDLKSMDMGRLRRFHGTFFTVSVSRSEEENPLNKANFVCIVSKKTAARAVDRNRIRRLCKEAFRNLTTESVDSRSYIFYAKKEAKTATLKDVSLDVTRLLALSR